MPTLNQIATEINLHPNNGECNNLLCLGCIHMVPGEGPADAPIMVIGEAPGAEEDAAGLPFVGRAGKLLNKLLEHAGLQREEVFVTNVVKARPPMNRDPTPLEIAHHRPWLEAQIAVIQPQIIVPLGRFAFNHFVPDVAIKEAHGTLVLSPSTPLFPLYHPAVALYNGQMEQVLYQDAKLLGKWLAMQ